MTQTMLFCPAADLVLEVQDLATAEDPLEIYLQRRGWNLTQVKELQESISAKMTIDMFSQETEPLSALELMLQADITAFLKSQRR